MRTKIIIIGIIIIIVALGSGVYFIIGSSRAPQPPAGAGSTQFPVAGQGQTTVGTSTLAGGTGTMALSGAGGSEVVTLDFINASSTSEDASNPGLYHLQAPPSANPAAPYDITYENDTQYFNISLLAEPIGQARLAMEQDLMMKLGIPENELCQLNYMVSVPYWVNSYFTGRNLGFSFCPGATELPQ